MADNDRTRQQSAEAPQGGGQQGGWQQGQPVAQGSQAASRQGAMQRQGEWSAGGGRGMAGRPQGYGMPSLHGGGAGGPFALMRRISDEMDRVFESFGMGSAFGGGWPASMQDADRGMRSLWSPHIEVCERDGKLVIQADLPGIRKEDVSVQIEDDRLVLQGERKQERSREEQGFYHTEMSYGSFHRVIPLPEGIDSDQAKASYRDGVLQIELPAPRQRSRGRTLAIEDRNESGNAQASSRGSETSGRGPDRQ